MLEFSCLHLGSLYPRNFQSCCFSNPFRNIPHQVDLGKQYRFSQEYKQMVLGILSSYKLQFLTIDFLTSENSSTENKTLNPEF